MSDPRRANISYEELQKLWQRVAQLEGFKVVLDGICDITTEFQNTNECVTVGVKRIKAERDQALIEKDAAQKELATCCEDRDAAVLERDAANRDAKATIVSLNEASKFAAESILKLTNEREALRQLNIDACADDIAIRDLCRPIIGAAKCDGDSMGVPTIVDVVEAALQQAQAEAAVLRNAINLALTQLRESFSGRGLQAYMAAQFPATDGHIPFSQFCSDVDSAFKTLFDCQVATNSGRWRK